MTRWRKLVGVIGSGRVVLHCVFSP